MSSLMLSIIVPDREYFHGLVDSFTVVTSAGEITVLPSHADYVSNVEISHLILRHNGHVDYYAIGGGALSIYQKKNEAYLTVNSIESVDEIDLERAEKAKKLAEERLLNATKIEDKETSIREQQKAEIRLKRALNRISLKDQFASHA